MTVRGFLQETGLAFTSRDVSILAELCKIEAAKKFKVEKKLVEEDGKEIMVYDYPEEFLETMADLTIQYFTNGRG